MTPDRDIALVRAHGSPYEVGRAHGAARAASLRRFLDDGLSRLNRILPRPVSLAELAPTLAAHREVLRAVTPALAEEVRGLADGAGLREDEALLLQLRREILGYRRIPAGGDCTAYARTARRAGGDPVLAQTVDLAGDLDDQIAVLDLDVAGRRVLVLSFGGLLGYLGVNAAGLAVGLNLVLGGEWRPGVPPYLAIRHLLDHAGGVDEAIELLGALPLASSRSLMLCDATRAACVEIVGDERRVIAADAVEHTNHLLHPDLVHRDEINVFAGNSSRRRLEACRAALADLPPATGVEEHFAVLCREPIRVADHGDIRLERTVAAVVMRPGRGELHVRAGDPAGAPTRSFAL